MLEVCFVILMQMNFRLLSQLVRLLREELQLLHEPGSYVGEVVKVMGKNRVLVKVQPEGKYSASIRSINNP
jgi:26S proteasome regulatory subunit T6